MQIIEAPPEATLWYDTQTVAAEVREALPQGYLAYPGPNHNQIVIELQEEGQVRSLFLPESWAVWEHTKGFGGWLLQGGRTLRFARPMVTTVGRQQLLTHIEQMRSMGTDFRDEYTKDIIRDAILETGGFTIIPLQVQMNRLICGIIVGMIGALRRRSEESIYRQQALFRNGVNQWMLKFPPMATPTQQIPFYQNQVVIDWEEFPTGARELIRDATVTWLYEHPFNDLRGGGPYICDPTATSKGNPGDWVSVVKTENKRRGPNGEELLWKGLKSPVLLAASQPILGNTKRANREFGGLKNALPLIAPKRLEDGICNGFEPYLTPPHRQCLTLAMTAFLAMEGVNMYSDRNLDDILVTPSGHTLLTTQHNEKRILSAEQFEYMRDVYLDENGYLRPGHTVLESLIPQTVFKGTPLYSKEYIVTDEATPELWVVGKIMIDSTLKAMGKLLTCPVLAIDANGNEYSVDLIVSGHSIMEKKTPSIILSAIASRVGIKYVADPENAVHPERRAGDEPSKYDDLVKEVYQQLVLSGESPDGKMDIYRIEDGERIHLGRAVVGITRACRLQENERSSSRVRPHGAVPMQIPLRHLDRRPAILDDDTRAMVNQLASTYSALTGDYGMNYETELEQ